MRGGMEGLVVHWVVCLWYSLLTAYCILLLGAIVSSFVSLSYSLLFAYRSLLVVPIVALWVRLLGALFSFRGTFLVGGGVSFSGLWQVAQGCPEVYALSFGKRWLIYASRQVICGQSEEDKI